MDLVESLSEGLADELRENRKGKLQRTFIGASDIAEARAKNLRCELKFFFTVLLEIINTVL